MLWKAQQGQSQIWSYLHSYQLGEQTTSEKVIEADFL